MNDGSAGSIQYLEVADSPHEFLLPCPDAVGRRLVGSKFFCLAVADKRGYGGRTKWSSNQPKKG
jgi:hypothetical protein